MKKPMDMALVDLAHKIPSMRLSIASLNWCQIFWGAAASLVLGGSLTSRSTMSAASMESTVMTRKLASTPKRS